MKRKLYFILFFSILALSLSWYTGNAITNTVTGEKEKGKTVTVQSLQATSLQIINSTASLKRGETGIITIQGKPNTRYTIETSYRMGGRSISIRQWRISDSSGRATFNWVVDAKTEPSTQSAVISGGGEVVETTHTVQP